MKAGLFCLALTAIAATPAAAQSSDEAEIRATVARWYEELAKKEKGRFWSLTAPGLIDTDPPYYHADNGSRALGPPVYASLSARALEFRYEIRRMRADASFAKVWVNERGYFYAAAAQKTYELHADTTFVFERQEKDGRWLILAHQSNSTGFPPSMATNPMPDLRDLYYRTEGKHRDPAKDAEAAKNF